MASSHYLNQCWNIVNWTLRNKLQWKCEQNLHIFIKENASENGVWKMPAILSQQSSPVVSWSIFSPNAHPSHKSHNASHKYPTMHHFVTEMCTHAHFCYKMVQSIQINSVWGVLSCTVISASGHNWGNSKLRIKITSCVKRSFLCKMWRINTW